MQQINGVICDTLTFYNNKIEVNEDLNSLLIKHILTNDVNTMLLFGVTGEGSLFSDRLAEKVKLINMALEITKKEVPIIVGVYGDNVETIIDQIEDLSKKSPEISYLVSPPLSKKVQKNVVKDHFENIFNSINPENHIYLHNNPNQFKGNEIDIDIIKNIKEISNCRGIIDFFYSIKSLKYYIQLLDKDFSVCCGVEENFQNFLRLIPLEQRKYCGIVSNVSNLANTCSKLFKNSIQDNFLEVHQYQEIISNIRDKIYDFKSTSNRENRGLKFAFLNLYKDIIPGNKDELKYFSPSIHEDLDLITKERIKATTSYFIHQKHIYRLYSLGREDIYQFHEIINTFSNIRVLRKQGRIKKIKGPLDGQINTIYKVKFENNQFKFRFRTHEFFRYENILKEKLLYPFLDKTLSPDMIELRDIVKRLINTQIGAYSFSKEKPPIIPIGNLIYYDETKEKVPYIFSIQEYIRGKPLNRILVQYIQEDINLKKKKIIDVFTTLGNYLGNLHEIRFNSFCKSVNDIGKRKLISFSEYFNELISTGIQVAQKNKIGIINEIRVFFKDNDGLIVDENEFVLLHKDFQTQNVIIEDQPGLLQINGFIDFDNWGIGNRSQDFVKMKSQVNNLLNEPNLFKAFLDGYSKKYKINSDFKARIKFFEVLWLLQEYNYEMEKSKITKSANIHFSTALVLLDNIKDVLGLEKV